MFPNCLIIGAQKSARNFFCLGQETSKSGGKDVMYIDARMLMPLCSNQKLVISENLRIRLQQIYLSDIEGLESLLRRDLTSWKQDVSV